MFIALHSREVSQKKNEIDQRITGKLMPCSTVAPFNLCENRYLYERQANKLGFYVVKWCPSRAHILSTVCRADIAKKRSHNEAVQNNIKKLKDEIRMKQSAVNGGNVKRYVGYVFVDHIMTDQVNTQSDFTCNLT